MGWELLTGRSEDGDQEQNDTQCHGGTRAKPHDEENIQLVLNRGETFRIDDSNLDCTVSLGMTLFNCVVYGVPSSDERQVITLLER